MALTIGTLSNIYYAPFFVGIEKGIFLKHGVDLKLKTFPGAAQVIQAVQAGDTQLGVGAWGGIAPAREQGIDLVGFVFIASDATVEIWDTGNAIFVRPGIQAQKVQDLVGLKIASSFGGGTDVFLRAHLAKAGVPLDRVTLMNVQMPNMLSALQAGADAGAAGEPWPSLIEAKLPGSRVLLHGGGVSDSRTYVVATSDWLSKNPELAEKVWAGAAESSQYARQHPDETAAAAMAFLTGMEQPIIRKALGHLSFDPRYTAIIERSLLAQGQQLVEQQKLKTAPKMDAAFAVGFMRSVLPKYPQFLSDLKPIPAGS